MARDIARWAAGTVVAIAAGVFVAVVRRRYFSVQVVGTSMEPTLRPGERIIVRRAGPSELRRGQIILVANPSPFAGDPPWLVKRVVALPGDPVPRDGVPALREVPEDVVPDGRLVLLGDNHAASFDSRTAGYFEARALLGVAVRRPGEAKPR